MKIVGGTDTMKAKFTSAGDAATFITAGHAVVTLVGKTSRFTYRVNASDDGRVRFVGVLTGNDNTRDYTYLGIIDEHGNFRRTAKSKISADAPSLAAFAWTYERVVREQRLPTTLEIWHEGRCGRCGRALTVPESIARGLGPECASHFKCEATQQEMTL